MLVIICAKYGVNSDKTVGATEQLTGGGMDRQTVRLNPIGEGLDCIGNFAAYTAHTIVNDPVWSVAMYPSAFIIDFGIHSADEKVPNFDCQRI